MGGRGSYFQRGGFSVQEYESTGKEINGIKVIKHKTKTSTSLPEMSNTPGTMYILESNGQYKQLGIYGQDRRLQKVIDITHGHTNRPKSGKVEKLKKGIAHIHHINGGRGSNVHYLTRRDIKKYGDAIKKMGGKLHE